MTEFQSNRAKNQQFYPLREASQFKQNEKLLFAETVFLE